MGDDLDGLFGNTKDECLEAIAQAIVTGNQRLAQQGVQVLLSHYQLRPSTVRKHLTDKKGYVQKRVTEVADDLRGKGLTMPADVLSAHLRRLAKGLQTPQASTTSST